MKTEAPSLSVTLDKFYLRHIVRFDSNYGAAAGNTPSFAGNCLPFVQIFFFPPPAALMYQTLTRGTELAPIQPIVNEADDILMANEPLLKDKLSSGKQTALSFFSLSLSLPPSRPHAHSCTRARGSSQFIASKKVDIHTWQLRQR